MTAIPALTTDRLILRAHTPEDYPAMLAMWADPAVTRHTVGRASTQEETWRRLLLYAGLWPTLGYGYWAAEERGTGAFVGDLGFADFHRDIDPPLGEALEMGWVFAPAFHGKGYASEACRAALGWAAAHRRGERVAAIVAVENAPSLALADRLGFREYGQTRYRDNPVALLER
jgi:RimJ/RimL family protein N-acetyltransferase